MSTVQTFPNFLSQEEWDTAFFDYLRRPTWQYGHYSGNDSSVHNVPYYWKMELDNDDFFSKHLVDKIGQVTGNRHELETVYAGGNTFGTSGDVHIDNKDDDAMTFLYHASPDLWKLMWGGKTIFFVRKIRNRFIRNLCQIKDYISNQTFLIWENPPPNSLRD